LAQEKSFQAEISLDSVVRSFLILQAINF